MVTVMAVAALMFASGYWYVAVPTVCCWATIAVRTHGAWSKTADFPTLVVWALSGIAAGIALVLCLVFCFILVLYAGGGYGID